MKQIIIDSSSLISLSETCLLKILERLKKNSNVDFIISKSVFDESVEKPMHIKRFELNAVRIKNAIGNGWISVHQPDKICTEHSLELERIANSVFNHAGKNVTILHRGELDSIVLLKELNSKILVIDERITRMLLEEPEELRKMLQRRQHRKIEINNEALKELHDFLPEHFIVRSSELAAWAFDEKNLMDGNSKQTLEAALYALKYKGCAISNLEIRKYLRGVKSGIQTS